MRAPSCSRNPASSSIPPEPSPPNLRRCRRASVTNRAKRICKGVSALPDDFTLLQVTPELETGGAEQTTLDISRAVVRAGGRSLVASRGGRMAARLKADGGRLIALPMQSKNPLTILANAERLKTVIRRNKVSVVHARSRAPAFSAYLAARACGVPYLATYHGVYEAKGELKRWYNAIMTRGEVVIANSAYTRERVIAEHDLAPEKVIAIDRGVDLERFDPARMTPERIATLARACELKADDGRARLILAGRLTRWKGQGLLVEAAARLKAQGRTPPLILLVGDDQGRGGYRGELLAAIEAANLKDSVRLLGHCDDMPAAYGLAEFACAPSLKPEPFGRTAVEPQAMGLPVLAADHGAARETVADGETGWLVAPGDAEAWATAIARAAALPPGARKAMGEAAMARARRLYSVEAMSEATLAIYARLAAPTKP
ncbi:MAG: glycosyltransferase family 4 protein [Caulobacteraceae bacterium]|nr:glycosyltransferase family 4 protein [Caulobacteraceae bacterium]